MRGVNQAKNAQKVDVRIRDVCMGTMVGRLRIRQVDGDTHAYSWHTRKTPCKCVRKGWQRKRVYGIRNSKQKVKVLLRARPVYCCRC